MPEQDTTIPLSDRELQVLQMVVTGASNQQIARQLVISVNTVKVHIRNIFEKLGVQSRTEASLRAIQEGWVVVEESSSVVTEAIAPLKTFLLPQSRHPLARWQQVYLTISTIVAVIVAAVPLLFTRSQETYIPPIVKDTGNTGALYGSETEVDVPIISEASNASHWTARDPMPTRRAGLGLAAFEGRIFAIGGVRTNNSATRFVEIYDPIANSWTEGAAKPTAVTNISSAVLTGKIYVPGGCTNNGQAVNKLEIYDPGADKWAEGAALPQPRCGYGLTAYKDQLYLFGGWDGTAYQDTVFVFSPDLNKWTRVESKLPQPLGYMGVATAMDFIYVSGGYNGQTESAQTYAFNPETGQWANKAPMQEKRGGLGLVNINNQLYAVGGGWEHPLATSERYDPVSDTWTAFETPFPHQWRNLGLTTLNSEIFAVGGWNGAEEVYMDDIVSYHVSYQIFLPFTGATNE